MADFGNIGEAFVNVRANFASFQKDLGKAQKNLGRSLQTIGGGFTNVGSKLTLGLTLPIIAVAAAAVKFGSDFESGFAGVRKTVDATAGEFKVLEKGFRDLAKSTGTSITEILAVGEAAGQLGIETKNILKFTEVMNNLGLTTNLSSNEAATALARLANITQLPQDQFDRLGSTIVALGNNLATTESEIVQFGLRIAGAGKLVGLSEAEILAFGGALSSVGVRAEAGGTAISRTFKKIAIAVADGGAELTQFAKVAGLSAAEFKEAFETDAAGATITFIEGLKRLSDAGVNIFSVLESLELQDQRLSDSLLRAAGAGDVFRNAIELGNKAFKENTALAKEAAIRLATFERQIQKLGEQFKDVFIDIFASLRPIILNDILPVIKLFLGFIGQLVKGFNRLPGPAKKLIIAIIAMAAALGPILVIIGSLISAVGTIVLAFGGMAVGAGTAGAGVLSFGAIMSGLVPLLATIGIALAAVTLAAAGVFAGVKLIEAIAQWRLIGDQLERVGTEARTNVLTSFNALKKAAVGPEFKEFADELERIFDTFQQTEDIEIFRAELDRVGRGMKDVQTALATTVERLDETAEATEDLSEVWDEASESADDLADAAKRLAEQQKAAAEATQSALQPFKSLIDQWNLAKEAGTTAAEFTAAFRDQIEAAGLTAEESARLFDLLGIEIDQLPDELQEAVTALGAAQVAIDSVNISIIALRTGILPLSLAVRDFAERLDSLTGPEDAARQNAEVLQKVWDELQKDTKAVTKEIRDLEKELNDYITVGATAAQVQEKFDARIKEAIRIAKIYGIEVGKTTKVIQKQLEAQKENADFAKEFQKAWTTAIGNVLGSFLNSIAEMDFSFKRFGTNLLSTLKNLGKSVVALFASAFFKPVLKAAQRFAENLADTIFSAVLGGKGPSGGLLGGVFDALTGGRSGGGGFGDIGKDVIKGLSKVGTKVGAVAKGVGGAFKSLIPLMTNPVTIAVAAAAAAIIVAIKLFTQTPFEAGTKEVTRDFNIDVNKGDLEAFIAGIGLTEEQFKPIRKDILSSPQAFKNLLLPAARAAGTVDELVDSFKNLTAFGKTFDLSKEAREAVEGNFENFNRRFVEIFGESNALRLAFGDDFSRLLVNTPNIRTNTGFSGETGDQGGFIIPSFEGNLIVEELKNVVVVLNQIRELLGPDLENLGTKLEETETDMTGLREAPLDLGVPTSGEPLVGDVFEITINAIDAESFRTFLSGQGGDTLMNELSLRRRAELTQIVQSTEKGLKE